MPSKFTHDIIIIGGGSGGLTCAIYMKRAGFKVLLIDRTTRSFGGDCLNYGCIPSKSLLHIANSVYKGSKFALKLDQEAAAIDIQRVMNEVRARQAVIRVHENPDYFKAQGYDIAIGEAYFSGTHEVTVGEMKYFAKHIVIATGSRPRTMNIEGMDTIPHFTSESIFGIQTLPKQFVFIGGGPINIELGQAFSRLGSNVTIVQSNDRILDKEEPEVSACIQSHLTKEGVAIICGVKTTRVSSKSVVVALSDGSEKEIPADALFVGIGRVSNIEKLQLKNAGIATNDRGAIILDDYLRTTNKAVSVVGDAAGRMMFTHAAELQALLVVRNYFSPFKKSYSETHMAWTTFTDPEVATFGSNSKQLNAALIRYEDITVNLSEDDRAITENATDGFLRLFIGRNGVLLGGVMVGNHAGEVVSELVLMMHAGMKLNSVLYKTFPYPIASRIILTAARQYASKRLDNSSTKRLLRILYR